MCVCTHIYIYIYIYTHVILNACLADGVSAAAGVFIVGGGARAIMTALAPWAFDFSTKCEVAHQ